MNIEDKNNLIDALKEGINIFVGSGFSLLAKDRNGKNLPLGAALANELKEKFDTGTQSLDKLATILKAKNESEFNSFLTERFTVCEFDEVYNSLNTVCVKYLFTTNIDNLLPQILKNDSIKYVNDLRTEGETDDVNAIHYLPLHGNVDMPDKGYIFSTVEIATIFENSPRIWSFLSHAIEKHPTLFLGYSMTDTSTLLAINSRRHTNVNCQKDKWILLKNPETGDIEYFKALGFNIIEGDIKEFLEEINTMLPKFSEKRVRGSREIKELFKTNLVPDSSHGLRARGILHFFRGLEPIWGDILSGNICRTSHFDLVLNSLRNDKKNTIIIGAPLCGKTTLAMQVASQIKGYSIKLKFDDMTLTKAQYIAKLLGKEKAFILIDNMADDVEAYKFLSGFTNIKLLGVAGSIDFGIVSHLIDQSKNEVINVTDLNDQDFQNVYKSLPTGSRKDSLKYNKETSHYKRDTIFEFVLNNIKGESIKERYGLFLQSCNENQITFLVLCAYMHYCRIPLSMEVALSFFSEDFTYEEVYELKDVLDDLLKELDDSEDLDNIDYYNPRSSHLADVILKSSPSNILKKVMTGIVMNVPQVQIPRYKIFKKRAFDHRIVKKAMPDVNEGNRFYDEAFKYDYNNPYILQQQALYLATKKQFNDAFTKIDRAMIMTSNKQFSIRNTHAIILFEANYGSRDNQAINQIDESMRILKECYKDDKRKTYHAEVFSEQALRYYKKIQNDSTISYLKLAKVWLTEELQQNPWNRDCRHKKDEICDILEKLSEN